MPDTNPPSTAILWLARLALASPFVLSGFTKAADFAGATGEVRGLTGLEPAPAFAAAVIAVQLGGSALLLAKGRAVWVGAAILSAFTLAATLLAHDFWAKPEGAALRDATTFLEHMGLVAGLGLAAILAGRDP
ncbi:DoxX family protein [Erythrobacter sp.]|uniref:DoxX family protein n=1 Tax=Erythrobacter sp. TaxID=1042 RepID=UPI0025DDA88A|nr:DoxX family protein [Erythrobacter sp.]